MDRPATSLEPELNSGRSSVELVLQDIGPSFRSTIEIYFIFLIVIHVKCIVYTVHYTDYSTALVKIRKMN